MNDLTKNDSARPIFIVSTGRAGSMMLSRVLANLDGVLALHEPKPHLVTGAYLRWAGKMSHERALRYIEVRRKDLILQASLNKLCYVESSHYCSHLIRELYELYGAKFIHLHRDGRSFVESGLAREEWYSRPGFKKTFGAWLRHKTLLPIGNGWNDHRLSPPRGMCTRVEKISWLWKTINEEIIRGLENVPADAQMRVPLEKFDEKYIEKIICFIGVSSSLNVDTDELLAAAESRPNKSAKEAKTRKRKLLVEEKQIFFRIAGSMMSTLGYDCSIKA